MACTLPNSRNKENLSELYPILEEKLGEKKAIETYALLETPGFIEQFGDWVNGDESIDPNNVMSMGEPKLHENKYGHFYFKTKEGKFWIDRKILNFSSEAREALIQTSMFMIFGENVFGQEDIASGVDINAIFNDRSENSLYALLGEDLQAIKDLRRLVIIRIQQLGFKPKETFEDVADDEITSLEEAEQGAVLDLKPNMEKNSKDNASTNIKFFLSTIPSKNIDGTNKEVIVDINGVEIPFLSFEPYAKMWNKFNNVLKNMPALNNANSVTSLFDRMIMKLQKEYPNDGTVQHAINLLLSYPEYKQNEFVHAFRLYDKNYSTSLLRKNGDNYSYRTFLSADVATPSKEIIANWNYNFQSTPVISVTPEGINSVNKTVLQERLTSIKDVIKRYEEARKNLSEEDAKKTIPRIQRDLAFLGIHMEEAAIEDYIYTFSDNFKSGLTNAFEQIRLLYSDLSTMADSDFVKDNTVTNVFNNAKVSAKVKKLADIEAKYRNDLSESTVIGAEGKTYWNQAQPSYLNEKVQRLKEDPENELPLKSGAYTYSLLLDKFRNPVEHKAFIDQFRIDTFGNFRLEDNNDAGVDNKGITEQDQTVDQLNKTLMGVKKGEKSKMYTLEPADKGTWYELHGMDLYTWTVNGGRVSDNIIDIFANYALDELHRAKEEMLLLEDIEGNREKFYKDYHFKFDKNENPVFFDADNKPVGNAFKSILFPQLNGINPPAEIQTLFKDGVLTASDDVFRKNEFVRNLINDSLQLTIKLNKARLENLKIIGNNKDGKQIVKGLDSEIFKSYSANVDNEVAVNTVVADYTINNMIAGIEYTKLISGDYAYYKSMVDLSKRIPASYTDGTYLNLQTDDPLTYKVAILPNIRRGSKTYSDTLLEDIEGAVQKVSSYLASTYVNNVVNQTDAQGWITLERWKFIMERSNHWNPDFEAAYQRFKDNTQTYEDYKLAAQPVKGVYFDVIDGVPSYIKYSAAVLIPSAIKGTALERMNQAMLDQGVSEAVVIDGIKVGAKIPSNLFGEGTINIYWGQAESQTSTRILSNLAPRKFNYQGKEYGSVEHAYQTLKSGEFDQKTYDAYNQVGGYGKKIKGKAVNRNFDNLKLMEDLVIESFKQNPNSEATQKLSQYSNFTHNTNEVIDQAFLSGLYKAKQLLQKPVFNNFNTIKLRNTSYKIQQDLRPKGVKETLIGSQLKKVLLTNIQMDADYDGINGKDLAQQFMDVLSDLSNKGLQNLQKELGFDDDGNIKDKAKLTDKIIENLLERGAGNNLIEALQKEYDYDYIANFRQKIQNTVMSLINNATVKIKANGASFIQMSSFGIDEFEAETVGVKMLVKPDYLKAPRLIEYTDAEGNIKRKVKPGQVFVTSSVISKYIPNWKDLSPTELKKIIDKEAFKMIGYRIPNQGMSSNDSLEIVGILPESYGDTIVPYMDITTKTGSDFDIDKMYVMLPNLKPVYNKATYTKARQYLKDINMTKEDILEEYGYFQTEGYISFDVDYMKSLSLKELENNFIEDILFNNDIENNTYFEDFNSKYEIGSIQKLEYIKFDPTKPLASQSKKAVQNRLIELAQKILESEHTFEALTKSIDANYLKDNIEELHGKENTNVDNLFFSPAFQIQKKFDNSGGKNGVGITANQLVDHLWTQWTDFRIISANIPGHREENTALFNQQYDINGKHKITDVISWFLNAYVDIAKDPYISKGNHNEFTASTVFAMIRNGVPIEFVNAFVGQEGLKELAIQDSLRKSRVGDVNYDTTIYQDAMKALLLRYNVSFEQVAAEKTNIREQIEKINDVDNPNRIDDLNKFTEGLVDLIKSKKTNKAGYLARQFALMDYFAVLKEEVGQPLNNAIMASKQDVSTNKDFVAAYANSNLVSKIKESQAMINFSQRFVNTFLGTAYDNSTELSLKILSKLFVTANESAQKIYDQVQYLMTGENGLVDEDLGFELEKALFAHIIGNSTIAKTNEELKTIFTGNFSIQEKVSAAKQMLPNNYFLSKLKPESQDGLKFVVIQNSKNAPPEEINEFSRSWEDLFTSGDPFLQSLAEELITVAYYQSGFKTNLGSFFQYIPVNRLKNLLENTLAYAKTGNIDSVSFIDKFVRHNWNNNKFKKLVPTVRGTMKSGYLQVPFIDPQTKVFNFNASKPYVKVYVANPEGKPNYTLYKNIGNFVSADTGKPTHGIFVPVSKLGYNNAGKYIYEYGANITPFGKSMIPSNNYNYTITPAQVKTNLEKMVNFVPYGTVLDKPTQKTNTDLNTGQETPPNKQNFIDRADEDGEITISCPPNN